MSEKKHPNPASMWPTRWIFHNRDDEDIHTQIFDVLVDIRNIVLVIMIFSIF
jgi:hypothetical protein